MHRRALSLIRRDTLGFDPHQQLTVPLFVSYSDVCVCVCGLTMSMDQELGIVPVVIGL
jgi:hypothetical protein